MSFNNSSGFFIKGKNTFNNVHGDQVIHNNQTTVTAKVVHMHGDNTKVTERTIFDQFEDVKRGHVIGMKDLGSVDLSEWDWHFENGELVRRRRGRSAQKIISTVQVHPNRQSNFTAITYEGEDAQEAWEKDFKQFSRARPVQTLRYQSIRYPNVDLSPWCAPPNLLPSITHSEPEHVELIPLAHFFTNSLWINIYIAYLWTNKRCGQEQLWLNTSSGVLCKGPKGPHFLNWGFATHKSVIQALPSTVDMLEEGSFIAFLSKFGSIVDKSVLDAHWLSKSTYLDDLFPTTTQDHQHKDNNHPQLTIDHLYLEDLWRNPPHYLPIDIIGELRFDTVYSPLLEPIARWPPEAPGLWRWNYVYGLVEETRVDGGLTRFKLAGQGRGVLLDTMFDWRTFQKGWLLQSSHVFDFLKTTGHQENFFLAEPPWELELRSTRREYDELLAFSDAVEETRPIYLFLYPLPMTMSQLISWMGGHTHFWSFDEDGRSRIPEEEWERWGIPILTPATHYDTTKMRSWPTHIYTALRKWQIARGFDPSTADWARECGYPEFEIVGAKKDDRFEEIPDQPASCDRCAARNLPCLRDASSKTKTICCIPCRKSRVRCSLNDAVITRKRKAPELGNAGSRSSKRLRSNDTRRRSTRAKK